MSDKCSWRDIDIGVVANSTLIKLSVLASEKIKLKDDFIVFVIAMVSKFKEQSLQKYQFTKSLLCFDPRVTDAEKKNKKYE